MVRFNIALCLFWTTGSVSIIWEDVRFSNNKSHSVIYKYYTNFALSPKSVVNGFNRQELVFTNLVVAFLD